MKDGKKAAVGLVVAGLVTTGVILATREVEAISPADIVMSDLIIEPSEVYVGEAVSIAVTATNIGEIKGSYEVTCEVM